MTPTTCPSCAADLTGTPIPAASQHLYDGLTHYGRQIGVEIPCVYDGVLYFVCPDCRHAWPQFTGNDRLASQSRFYAERANTRTAATR